MLVFVALIGDRDRAEELYTHAIEADPRNANNLGNFSKLLFCHGDMKKADLMRQFSVGDLRWLSC